MVEQLGLAIMPLCHFTSSGFTSGTTNGTCSSILKAELLSIAVTPLDAAIGTNFSLIDPPAAKKAMSISYQGGLL